jgi:hypothetical protein
MRGRKRGYLNHLLKKKKKKKCVKNKLKQAITIFKQDIPEYTFYDFHFLPALHSENTLCQLFI